MKRTVVGIQLHHHTYLGDSVRGMANGLAGLMGAYRLTDNPRLLALHDQAQAILREISREEKAAAERFREFSEADPEGFKRCREGFEPWPDEVAEGFVPRCTCHDKCLHRFGVEPEVEGIGICNCEGVKPACPQHG